MNINVDNEDNSWNIEDEKWMVPLPDPMVSEDANIWLPSSISDVENSDPCTVFPNPIVGAEDWEPLCSTPGEDWLTKPQDDAVYDTREYYGPPPEHGRRIIKATGTRTRFTSEQTRILQTWLSNHMNDPYPERTVQIQLASATRLNVKQVQSWFARARQRWLQKQVDSTSTRNEFELEDLVLENTEHQRGPRPDETSQEQERSESPSLGPQHSSLLVAATSPEMSNSVASKLSDFEAGSTGEQPGTPLSASPNPFNYGPSFFASIRLTKIHWWFGTLPSSLEQYAPCENDSNQESQVKDVDEHEVSDTSEPFFWAPYAMRKCDSCRQKKVGRRAGEYNRHLLTQP